MMSKELTLKILTPEGTAFCGAADAVHVPGTAGRFEILPDHASIISSLVAGELRWRHAGKERSYAVRSGAIMLKDNEISVCAEPAE